VLPANGFLAGPTWFVRKKALSHRIGISRAGSGGSSFYYRDLSRIPSGPKAKRCEMGGEIVSHRAIEVCKYEDGIVQQQKRKIAKSSLGQRDFVLFRLWCWLGYKSFAKQHQL
jgi:hypothetical protein